MSTDSIYQRSARGVSYLVGAQFLSRMCTFALNQMTLRLTEPGAFGLAAVQLELLISMGLAIARQGFRTVMQRNIVRGKAHDETIQLTVNMAYMTSAFGGLCVLMLCCVYALAVANDEARGIEFFGYSVVMYGVAALLELMSEPFYAYAELLLCYQTRVKAESVQVVMSTLVTFASAFYSSRHHLACGALPFALGSLASRAAYLCMFVYGSLVHAGPNRAFSFLPTRLRGGNFTSSGQVRLALWFSGQNIFKQLLTEADKLAMTWYMSTFDQGVYAVVANYGSLMARIVFLPVEDASRNLMAKLNVQGRDNDAVSTLSFILRAYTLLMVAVVIFGLTYGDILLQLAAGQRFHSIESVHILRTYIIYLPFLAFNGVLEAYVASVSSAHILRQQSQVMLVGTLVFVAVFRSLADMGAMSLVVANCCNLMTRILWCLYYIFWRRHSPSALKLALPSVWVWPVAAAACAATYKARQLFEMSAISLLKFIGIGIVAGGVYVAIVTAIELPAMRTFRARK